MENHITTSWTEGMTFESNNISGHTLTIGTDPAKEGSTIYRPKALMLSALGGCTGLDVVSLFTKMKLEVDDFKVETIAHLTDEDPKHYDKVRVEYHFWGSQLNEERLNRCVTLSVDKYCGVFEMFRQFAEMETAIIFHKK